MILRNIAHHALVRGSTVRFTTAGDRLADLAAQNSSASLGRLKESKERAAARLYPVGRGAPDDNFTDLTRIIAITNSRRKHRHGLVSYAIPPSALAMLCQ